MQPGSMQEMMQRHQRMMQQGSPQQMSSLAHGADATVHSEPCVVRDTGPDQELAGGERVQERHGASAILSIRATAPDGSRVAMQVSSEGLYGVVVNPTDQATSSSGTGDTSSNYRRHQYRRREQRYGQTSSSTGRRPVRTGGTAEPGARAAAPVAPAAAPAPLMPAEQQQHGAGTTGCSRAAGAGRKAGVQRAARTRTAPASPGRHP